MKVICPKCGGEMENYGPDIPADAWGRFKVDERNAIEFTGTWQDENSVWACDSCDFEILDKDLVVRCEI